MPGHIVYNQEEFIGFIKDVIDGKDATSGGTPKNLESFSLSITTEMALYAKRLAEYLGLKK